MNKKSGTPSATIIQFPTRARQQETSPEKAVIDFITEVSQAPSVTVPRKRVTSAVSQSIQGDGNHQAAISRGVRQSIKGNNNTQISGPVKSLTIRAPRASRVEISPPPGSIGASPALRLRIEALLKEIEAYRYERIGDSYKFGSVHGILAKAFGLTAKEWKIIWLWDEARASEVITWLEAQRDNTMGGRIKKAAKRDGYQHTRGRLFERERGYISQLGWSDDQARHVRLLVSGEASRADMTDDQFRNWVAHLRVEVLRMYGESDPT